MTFSVLMFMFNSSKWSIRGYFYNIVQKSLTNKQWFIFKYDQSIFIIACGVNTTGF